MQCREVHYRAELVTSSERRLSRPDSMAPTRGPDCVVCHATARYTCPGCSARTCSLPCSTTHKTSSSCSGQRDRAAYVSREQYGYVDLMEDYRFLEDVSRRMGETTKVVKEAQRSLPRSQATRAASRGGRGAGQAGRGGPGEGLRRMAMATCEVELVLLPVGMAKREANKTRIVTSGCATLSVAR